MQYLTHKPHFLHNIASDLSNILITETYGLNRLGYTTPDSHNAFDDWLDHEPDFARRVLELEGRQLEQFVLSV